jgi:hypothetical protein
LDSRSVSRRPAILSVGTEISSETHCCKAEVIRKQDWDGNDSVVLNDDGQVGWIQMELLQVAGADRYYHSFWVHKLWRID